MAATATSLDHGGLPLPTPRGNDTARSSLCWPGAFAMPQTCPCHPQRSAPHPRAAAASEDRGLDHLTALVVVIGRRAVGGRAAPTPSMSR